MGRQTLDLFPLGRDLEAVCQLRDLKAEAAEHKAQHTHHTHTNRAHTAHRERERETRHRTQRDNSIVSYADSAVWQQWPASGAHQFLFLFLFGFLFGFLLLFWALPFAVLCAAYLADIVSVSAAKSGGLAARYALCESRTRGVVLPSCLLVVLSSGRR